MQNAFLFVDLFLTDIALRYEVIVFGLILEIGQINLIDYASIVFFEEIHILDQVIFVVVQNLLDFLFVALVLDRCQLILFHFLAADKTL